MRFSVGRRRCRRTTSAIRRWRCRCTSGFIRCWRRWSRSCCHHYRAVRVCSNDGPQTHRRHKDDHDKQHDREFPGHCASGDRNTPGDTLPLTTGKSSRPRYGDVPYRYTPFELAASPSFRWVESGPALHRTVRLGGRTGRVNGTQVLALLVPLEFCGAWLARDCADRTTGGWRTLKMQIRDSRRTKIEELSRRQGPENSSWLRSRTNSTVYLAA